MRTELLGVVLQSDFTFELIAPEDEYPYRLYLIRDAERPLYAGQSKWPASRIRGHVHNRDGIGSYILEYQPASLSWLVDFMTLLDFGFQTPARSPNLWAVVNRAERMLIKGRQPLLNSARSKQGRT